jgi:hypothetical protein
MHRTVALLAISLVATAVSAAGATAQTLTDPNPKTSPPPPPAAAKSAAAQHLKSCSAFGTGFIQIPGTDGCVKIGGNVSTDVSRY